MNELLGKSVVDAEAQILGSVCDFEFDEQTLKISHLCTRLEKA
jgi:sporulation protein YlmC with PRC-barrel domain